MKSNKIEEFNSNRYATDDDMDILMHYSRYKKIIQLIQQIRVQKKNIKVLDLGCGPGHLGKMILEEGFDVWGADISDNSIQLAKEKGLKVIKASFEDRLPFQDQEFDIVVSSEVIEHIYDTESFIQEINRIMKKNASLIITTPNVASFGRRIFLLLGKNPILEYQLSGGAGHIRYFTFKDMNIFLANHGFIVDKQITDIINLSARGKINSIFLGKMFPKFGRSIITLCHKS
jgi:methionine biosynthesis protein MetW